MVQFSFDASQHEPRSFDPIPAGTYIAQITQSEMKQAKSGANYIQLRFDIVDGPHTGRVLFENLNLWHPNAVAVEIAQGALAGICRACGVVQLQNTQELHGKPLKIKIKIKAAQGDYDASNQIVGYEAAQALPAQEPFAPKAAPKKAKAAQTATPAWAVGGTDDEDEDMPF